MDKTDWYTQEFTALINFAKKSRVQNGFGTMNADGSIDPKAGLELWINCRMTHIFALATLKGDETCRPYLNHGILSLLNHFYDTAHGGFFNVITPDANQPYDTTGARKLAYAHAFVLLAACSGIQAGAPHAKKLFKLAIEAHETYFWEPKAGLVCESWDRSFTENEAYRGMNANMHTVEALLAAWDACPQLQWLEKVASILQTLLAEAAKIGWRVPEHFDVNWQLLPDFNKDQPADPFRPFGVTPGHGIEWARLALQFSAAVRATIGEVSTELTDFACSIPEKAYRLLTTAIKEGWNVDGALGIVYTTDFSARPVVHERMHWTICEGISAACAFAQYFAHNNDPREEQMMQLRETLVAYAREYLIEAPGRWIHELDMHNQPSGRTWPGKPDIYHAAQAMLMPQLPLTPCFAGAFAQH